MAAHVMCLTSSGGIPVFARQKGEGDMMTFSKMASLNGVHMYLKSQNIDLKSTNLPDTTVMWREYEECLTLIAIANGATKYVLRQFLDAVFAAMVLFVGIDEIKGGKSVEKIKRDVRASYAIIDRLLECLDVENEAGTGTDIIHLTECTLSYENHLLQTCLEAYMECLDSKYGCVLVHGCLAVATDEWWSLDAIERKLLILAITTEDNCTVRDLPVFLPRKSPNVAFRLVSVTLINHVEVLALCGPSPELLEIERLAVQCWKNAIEALRNSEQCCPRNLPATISLDSKVLGFLLVNHKIGKFVLGRNSQCTENRSTVAHQQDMLRHFYHQAVETFLLSAETAEDDNGDDFTFENAQRTHWVAGQYRCDALKEGDNILCVLYTFDLHPYTMRHITDLTSKIFLTNEQIRW